MTFFETSDIPGQSIGDGFYAFKMRMAMEGHNKYELDRIELSRTLQIGPLTTAALLARTCDYPGAMPYAITDISSFVFHLLHVNN